MAVRKSIYTIPSTVTANARSYLQRLADLTQSALVTDREGAAISLDEGAERAVRLILAAGAGSGKVMAVGNGGSATIASHMQNDLCKAVGVPGMVFTEPALLMALANDDGYETVFESPIELWARPGDVLVAISSSGRSENVLRGVRAATLRECHIITFTGFDEDNPLRRMGDINFYVASQVYGFVENAHAAITHFITDRAMSITKEQAQAEVGA